jgi:hypothetical protein
VIRPGACAAHSSQGRTGTGPPQGFKRCQVYSEPHHPFTTGLSQNRFAVHLFQHRRREKSVIERNPEFARQMVVADPRLPERRILRPGSGARQSAPGGEPHHGFQKRADIIIGKGKIAMPSLSALDQEVGAFELPEVGTRRLDGHPGLRGQFARGQRPAGHQRGQHVGARRIADQRAQLGYVRTFFHTSMLVEA